MSLHTEIKQFLAAVKDPASLTTTRVSLEQAVGLLGRVIDEQAAVCVKASDWQTVMNGRPIFSQADVDSALKSGQKPEDKL